jgi:hypothetical protein
MIPFRDPDQRLRACRTLLSAAGLARLWTSRGPTAEARKLVAEGLPQMTPEERVVLLAAWALWTGDAPALPLGDVAGCRGAEPLLQLLIASFYGPGAIDVWLARPDREGYVVGARATHAAAAHLFDDARAVLAEDSEAPVNMNAAPDACALGVRQMADYALIVGVEPIEDDEKRHKKALELAVHALGAFAKLSADAAAKGAP